MASPRNAKPLPTIFIDKEVVNERVNNFLNNKHPVLTTAIGKPESKAAWYSLEQFEELVREMYYQNADGIRIYFGAYSDNDPDYANQLTIIFVPTYLDESTGNHKDIVIDDDEDFGVRSEVVAKIDSFAKNRIPKSLDTLVLCPPTCDHHELLYPY